MKFNFDSQLLGATLGLLAPAIAFFSYYFINYNYMTAEKFFKYMQLGQITSAVTSLCVLSNLLVFFIFIWTKKYYSARGVLLSTFIYAALVCYLKFSS